MTEVWIREWSAEYTDGGDFGIEGVYSTLELAKGAIEGWEPYRGDVDHWLAHTDWYYSITKWEIDGA